MAKLVTRSRLVPLSEQERGVKNAIRDTEGAVIGNTALNAACASYMGDLPGFRLRWFPRTRMQRDAITLPGGPSLSSIEIT
jgi:hypothetical protein